MKTTKLVLGVVSILVVLAFTLSYAEEEKAYVPTETEEYYGTWVNQDYTGTRKWAKYIVKPDRTWMLYLNDSDKDPLESGTFTIAEKWTDSEGNTWIKKKVVHRNYEVHYLLERVSNSGSTLEWIASPVDYPTELGPSHPVYHIYNRE